MSCYLAYLLGAVEVNTCKQHILSPSLKHLLLEVPEHLTQIWVTPSWLTSQFYLKPAEAQTHSFKHSRFGRGIFSLSAHNEQPMLGGVLSPWCGHSGQDRLSPSGPGVMTPSRLHRHLSSSNRWQASSLRGCPWQWSSPRKTWDPRLVYHTLLSHRGLGSNCIHFWPPEKNSEHGFKVWLTGQQAQ